MQRQTSANRNCQENPFVVVVKREKTVLTGTHVRHIRTSYLHFMCRIYLTRSFGLGSICIPDIGNLGSDGVWGWLC